tara:strand:- start:1561 stop:2562 length:1002 start_codon:yes stop_codon:yes gene_type:complete
MQIQKLKKLISKILLKYNLNKKDAEICTKALINAELVGAPSHGVSRLKMYCERINKKVINPKPKIKIKRVTNSVSLIDADNSIGFVAADTGIKETIKIAKKTGIAFVGIKNSGHYGLSGYYIEQAVKKNLLAFAFTNAPPAIAPHGGKKTIFGTNPICFGSPTNNNIPFILDTSMSMINRGKIRVAAKLNKSIPKGVALDKFGKQTTNAKDALSGVQLPIAGFRGSGLAWMVDILTGVFVGSAHSGKVKDPFDDFRGPQNIGHLFIAFKNNLFVKNFKQQIKVNINRIKNIPKIKGEKIYYPGERKFFRKKLNSKKTIKIPSSIKKDLDNLLS